MNISYLCIGFIWDLFKYVGARQKTKMAQIHCPFLHTCRAAVLLLFSVGNVYHLTPAPPASMSTEILLSERVRTGYILHMHRHGTGLMAAFGASGHIWNFEKTLGVAWGR